MIQGLTDTVVLRKLNLFKDLSTKELDSIRKKLHEQQVSKGELVFSEGDTCEKILIVRSGRVKLFRLSSDGREQILEILESGDTCACNPGSVQWCCSASAQALSDVVIWYLDRSEYVHMVQSNHKLSKQLNEIFAQRICRLCSLIEEVSLKSPQKRLVKFILDVSEADRDNKDFRIVSFTHDEISQRLGLVRETVTRHLNQLKKANLIGLKDRKIIIQDPSRLRNFLETNSSL
ncbi:MAG: Crp/Fnr family transcriptional regulator [Candidatus Omnitrophica bacterium]|nr:Crp/Fnr family transcriptional regulator [Candidatus Omnitrophota bacterium]